MGFVALLLTKTKNYEKKCQTQTTTQQRAKKTTTTAAAAMCMNLVGILCLRF